MKSTSSPRGAASGVRKSSRIAGGIGVVALALVLACSLAVNAAAQGGSLLAKLMDERTKGNEASASSQAKIDALSDAANELATEYRRTLQETRGLQVYNGQVEELIAAQKKEMAALQEQIDSVTGVGRQVMPLMLRMIDTLDAFVELDLPFLRHERRKRIADLRAMMNRADVTLSEQYRRILEAYQIENEFGRTLEAYRASLDVGGASRTVDFLRVGRVALLYQTLDAEESGMWDSERKKWDVLSNEYRNSIRQGLRMARKQVAPDLIRIPVRAAQEVN